MTGVGVGLLGEWGRDWSEQQMRHASLFLGAPIWASGGVGGGGAGTYWLLWMCDVLQGPSGWTTELRKDSERWSESLCVRAIVQKQDFLQVRISQRGPNTQWRMSSPCDDEATALRAPHINLPPLSEMFYHVDKQRSKAQARGGSCLISYVWKTVIWALKHF